MQFDNAKIQPYLKEKLVTVKSHPDHPHIKLYDYTAKCQFEKKWDEITTVCRGIIEERFWQSLRNHSGAKSILFQDEDGKIWNTFYWEAKNQREM